MRRSCKVYWRFVGNSKVKIENVYLTDPGVNSVKRILITIYLFLCEIKYKYMYIELYCEPT